MTDLQKIIKSKKRDLLNSHKTLLTNFLNNQTNLHFKTKTKILNYYDTQINQENIEQHYSLHIKHFLYKLLT